MTRLLRLNIPETVMVFLVSSTDHISGLAGQAASMTITESKAGGSFTATAPAITDRGNGWYALTLLAANMNTMGEYCLHITATGADPIDVKMLVVGFNPFDGTRLGLAALPTSAVGTAGGLIPSSLLSSVFELTIGANSILPVDVKQWTGVNVTGQSDGYPLVQANNVQRQALAQAGTATTITLDAGASAVDNFYQNSIINVFGGTGFGQARRIISYVGATKIATVDRAWLTNPASGSRFYITPDAPSNVGYWNGGAVPATSSTGVPKVDSSHWNGTAVAAPNVGGVPKVDVTHFLGGGAAVPTVAGIPRVEVASVFANAISAASIAAGAITNSKFAAGAIDAAAIASNAITSAKIAAGAITSSQIATDAIGAAQLAAAGVGKIADAVMNYVIEAAPAGADTFIKRLRVFWSVFAGKASGLTVPANTTETFRDAADTKPRATFTMNTSGTRTPGAFDGS